MNKNEIFLQFIEANEAQLKAIVELTKNVLDNPSVTVSNESIAIMLELLQELCLHEEKIEEYFRKEEVEEVKGIISNIVHEEKEIILGYFDKINKEKNKEITMLKNIEWKCVGLSTSENFDKGILTPKIIMKLIFTNRCEKIFESDFATIKKLQEEVEECVSGFNSTYARRIETFAK